jgi:hypothetical protein
VLKEIAADADNLTDDEIEEAEHVSKERYLAVAFILDADRTRYGIMLDKIENKYLRNRDQSSKVGSYPTTVADAYEYLENYKNNPKNVQRLLRQIDPGSSGLAFVQTEAPTAETEKKPPGKLGKSTEVTFATRGDIICKWCGNKDHKSPDCRAPNNKAEAYKATQVGNTGFSQLIVSSGVNWDSVDSTDEASNFS